MADRAPLGFIGTGVMGEPMARNLAQKCGRPVLAWDPDPAPLERLAAAGVGIAADADAVARAAEVVTAAVDPIDDLHVPAWYRRKVASVMAARACRDAIARMTD